MRRGQARWALVAVPAAAAVAIVAVAAVTVLRDDAGSSRIAAGAEPRKGPAEIAAVQLENVAPQAGLRFRQGAFRFGVSNDPVAMMGGGLCWLDYDDDGWLDLFVVNSYAERDAGRWEARGGLPRSALFRNVGGRFVDVSAHSRADVAVRGNGCVAADFDLDGRTDLLVTAAGSPALLWNEGDGTFTEGSRSAGVNASGWYAGAAVGDVNRDGWPDLFLSGYADLNAPVPGATQGFPNTYIGVRDLLYLSRRGGDGGRVTFREAGAQVGLEVTRLGYGLGATFSDYDRDGDVDLYVANDTNPNRLYQNVPWPGGARADPFGFGFRLDERAASAGVADPNAGMGIAAADYDGDGRTDIFVTNARGQEHAAYRSEPLSTSVPAFVDARPEFAGAFGRELTGWGASWVDLDLDTDLDLVVANGAVPVENLDADAEPIQVIENRAAQGDPGEFAEVGDAVGVRKVPPVVGRGLAAADYDNDGDLDVAVNSVGGPLLLLQNQTDRGNWLEVAVKGFHPGAEVTVTLPDGRELRRAMHSGSSYLSSEDPRCHFGLGGARRVREVVVRLPGGRETRVRDVGVNRLLVLEAPK